MFSIYVFKYILTNISIVLLLFSTFSSRFCLANIEDNKDQLQNDSGPINNVGPNSFYLQIPENYSRFEIPLETSKKPLNVKIQLNIFKILDFNEEDEEVKLDLEFRVFWTDFNILNHYNEQCGKAQDSCTIRRTIEDLSPNEIKRKRITLNNPELLEKLWKPNLFIVPIENLLKVNQPIVMSKLLTLKVIPEVGWFEYLTRIIVTLNCEMEFKFYPADTQNCGFSIRPFSYTNERLKLGWYKTGVWLHDPNLPNFDVMVGGLHESVLEEDDEAIHKTNSDEAAGQFHLLGFHLIARRNLSYHLVQTYLSSTFYIIITCLCFLIPARLVEARVGVCMTTLLTLTAMFAAVRESTPQTSCIKAIDVWMVGCIFFVFLTLAEFTVYLWLQSLKEDAKNAEESEERLIMAKSQNLINPKDKDEPIEKNGPFTNSTELSAGDKRKLSIRKLSIYSKESIKVIQKFENVEICEKLVGLVDTFSFPMFISLFGIFTVMYWVWLLGSSDYFIWDVDPNYNNI